VDVGGKNADLIRALVVIQLPHACRASTAVSPSCSNIIRHPFAYTTTICNSNSSTPQELLHNHQNHTTPKPAAHQALPTTTMVRTPTYHTPPQAHQLTNNQSLRLIPTTTTITSTPSVLGAPSAPGVHDTLRHNLSLSAPAPKSTGAPSTTSSHPLEARLSAWKAQQDSLKMSLLRKQFGIAEPVRRGMELAIVSSGEWRPAVLGEGSAGLHRQILEGRDCEIDWEDVYQGQAVEGGMAMGMEFHGEMERRCGMEY
jgi:proteasome maturation protein